MTNIEPIETDFVTGQFRLEQIRRDGDLAIYRKTTKDGRPRGFEVVQIQKRKAWEVAGKTFPAKEGYPPSEHWGLYGWTCTTEKRAHEKLQEWADFIAANPK